MEEIIRTIMMLLLMSLLVSIGVVMVAVIVVIWQAERTYGQSANRKREEV